MFKRPLWFIVFGLMSCGDSGVFGDGAAPDYIPKLRINEISADSDALQTNIETDWIELKNISSSSINLEGYSLTDNSDKLTKWTFPDTVLDAGEYVVIRLIGDDTTEEQLSAPFSLNVEGEYLALVDPDNNTIVDEFTPYPGQRTSFSYGIDEDDTDSDYLYFATPTPGQKNTGDTFLGITQRVHPSVGRGFYEEAFVVDLESEDGIDIYYSVDGTMPSVESGILYDGPLTIDETTVVRTIATKENFLVSDRNAHSYIFVDDVLSQPALPANYPSEWQPGAPADYAIDSTVASRADLLLSMRSYPTVSLTMPIDDWFNQSTDPTIGGIYSNSVVARGFEWERAVSAEFFDFDHQQEIQVEAGIRIFGNASRLISRPKHNMRLVFRKQHGPGKLTFPLFGEDDTKESVNGYLLRGGNGDSWFHPTASKQDSALYIRDQLSRELHQELGAVEVPQSHVHLYINGLYWGLYHTIERIEASSMAAKFGGEEEDWDIVKASRRDGMQVVDGSLDSWGELQTLTMDVANGLKGIDELENVMDLRQMANYLLLNYYGGNIDWDDNNVQAAKRRTDGDRWRFFQWDSENVFRDPTEDVTLDDHDDRVTAMHHRLLANQSYRTIFQEQINALLKNDGLLTPNNVTTRFSAWVEKQRLPLLMESARWGDHHRLEGQPVTVVEWEIEVARMLNSHLDTRTQTTLQQLAMHGFDIN